MAELNQFILDCIDFFGKRLYLLSLLDDLISLFYYSTGHFAIGDDGILQTLEAITKSPHTLTTTIQITAMTVRSVGEKLIRRTRPARFAHDNKGYLFRLHPISHVL